MNTHRIGLIATTVVAAAATAVLATGTAAAHDKSGHSEAHGVSPFADFQWNVSRDSDGHAHGYFQGMGQFGASFLFKLKGPITCAQFEGNTVRFVYRVENSNPLVLDQQYILITGVDNGGHGRDRMGFQPATSAHGCVSSIAPAPVFSGHIGVRNDDSHD